MALCPCPECGKRISEYAKLCPRCGYEPERGEGAKRIESEAGGKTIQERKGTILGKDWQKLFKAVIWVISIVFPTYFMIRSGAINPIIWIQGFVLIWLFYVIVFLMTSPVRMTKAKLSQIFSSDPVKRFKNWLSQNERGSE